MYGLSIVNACFYQYEVKVMTHNKFIYKLISILCLLLLYSPAFSTNENEEYDNSALKSSRYNLKKVSDMNNEIDECNLDNSAFSQPLQESNKLLLKSRTFKEGRNKATTEQKRTIYHDNSFEEKIAGISLPLNPDEPVGYVHSYGPKKRKGGLGPTVSTIEISPWVQSLTYINKLPISEEGEELKSEFIFEPQGNKVYFFNPLIKKAIAKGHCALADQTLVQSRQICGGELIKISGNTFRTDEYSGHYGLYWNDERRFRFIELMYSLGIKVIHEPWMRDIDRIAISPELHIKYSNFSPINKDDLDQLPRDKLFEKLSHEELQIYQDNFIRKFGNSILNMGFPIGLFTPIYSSKYESYKGNNRYTETSLGTFTLKEEYRNVGILDLKFEHPEYGIISAEAFEDTMMKVFRDKYNLK